MAAKAGGFNYKFRDGQWVDTKDSSEFFANLSRYASEQSGQTLVFAAPAEANKT
jgi:CyaY protein